MCYDVSLALRLGWKWHSILWWKWVISSHLPPYLSLSKTCWWELSGLMTHGCFLWEILIPCHRNFQRIKVGQFHPGINQQQRLPRFLQLRTNVIVLIMVIVTRYGFGVLLRMCYCISRSWCGKGWETLGYNNADSIESDKGLTVVMFHDRQRQLL